MYLTFDEYKELGGDITDESTFTVLEKRAEAKINSFTFGTLKTATIIPDEVKELIVQYIPMINEYYVQSSSQMASYSNGTESISYATVERTEVEAKFLDLAKEFLADTGLLYRGGARFAEI